MNPENEKENIQNLKNLFGSIGFGNEWQQKLPDFFPAVIYIYDTQNKKLSYVNKRVTDLLGFSSEDIQEWDNDVMKFVFKEDVALFENELQKYYNLKDEESHEYKCRYNHKNGDWRYFKTTGTILRKNEKGEPQSFLFIAQDISEQMKMNEEIQKNTELVTNSEKLLKFGTYCHIPETDQMTWSHGLYDIMDFDKTDEPETSHEFYISHIIPADREIYLSKFENALAARHDFHIVYHIITNKNKKKVVSTSGTFINKTNDNNTLKVFGITRDITQAELTELELRQNISSLNRSNKELEEFAYIASHDMQEPLRKIQTFGERLQTKYADVLGDDGKIYLTRIMASSEIMRNLIDNLLEFSRITRRSQVFEPTDLNIIIKLVAAELELRFDETNARLVIDNYLPQIEAIPLQMRQVFTNLIGNAIKFRRKNANPLINIGCRPATTDEIKKHILANDKPYYSISIKDNGIGFEQNYAEKIFQIFQRLHGKTEYPGSGIGLAICKKIIDHHQGVIYAESEPQKGTTFTLILPLTQTSANAAAKE